MLAQLVLQIPTLTNEAVKEPITKRHEGSTKIE